MKQNLVALIVTFNRIDKLQESLGLTLAQPFHRVVVVNNCSTDGTASWLDQQQDERLIVLHNTKNLGGAGGFHRGFEYIANDIPDANWLVCFDDDAFPHDTLIDTFNALDIPDQIASMAGAVYLPSGCISEMNRPSRNPFWHLKKLVKTAFRGRHGFHLADKEYHRTSPVEIDASSFVGFFIRIDLIRKGKVGLPRKELFIYADDIIYVLELRKRGFKHWFAPTLAFTHDCETLINQQSVYRPLWKAYYTFRNGLEMYRIAAGFFYPFTLLVKIPKFFLSVRHYEPTERRLFLRITRAAVWDGLRRDYSRTHNQVLALSSPPEQASEG